MSSLPVPTKLHDLVHGDVVVIDDVQQTITEPPRKIVDGAVEFRTNLNEKGFYFHPSKTPTLPCYL